MVDIFAQRGITFESASMASTSPTATPDAIPAPSIKHSSTATAPISTAGAKNNVMSEADRQQATQDLFGEGEAAGEPAPSAPEGSNLSAPLDSTAPAQGGRDLFAERGIEPPNVEETNAAAFTSGVSLNTKPAEDFTIDRPPEPAFTPISRASMSQVDFGENQLQLQKQVQEYAASDDNAIMKLASMRFTPAQIEAWKTDKIGFVEAFSKLTPQKYLPGGGAVAMYDALEIAAIGRKAGAGEELTESDQSKLNAFLDAEIEQRVRGFSWGGNVAYVGSQIPAFAIEFAISDGVGKVAQTAARKTAEKVAMTSALQTSIGVASRVATTTALMPGQYLPRFGERRLNDIMAVTDKGDLVLKESTESPAKSALLAFAHTSAEVASEISGAAIGKYLLSPATKLVRTPLTAAVNNLPAATKDALYNAYKLLKPNAKVSKVFNAAGWNGMVEELGEERVADILHATLDMASDDKMTMDQYLDRITPSKDQLFVEAGLIGIAGGLHSSASVALNLIKTKGISAEAAQEAVHNMTALELDNYVSENLPTPVSSYPDIRRVPVLDSTGLPAVDLPTLEGEAARKWPYTEGVITNPEAPVAPEAAAYMDQPMQPDKAASILYDGHAARTQIDAAELADPPAIIDEESTFNYLNRALFNRGAPAEVPYNNAVRSGFTPSKMSNTSMLMSLAHQTPELVRSHLMVNTFKWDEDGKIIDTGKSLKSTLDDYDNYFMTKETNRETRYRDFEDFLIARHYLSLGKTAPHVEVTPEQKTKSSEDLQRIVDKYGEDAQLFETFGNEFVEFRNRTRDLLVGSLLTKEQRANEREMFPYSVPLKREMEPKEYEGAVSRGDYSGLTPGSLTKHLKGSALPVKNILHSTLRETARVLDFVQRNRVNKSIFDLREFAPDQVQETQLPIVKKGTAEFNISYDPKLRDKLDKMIDFLGGSVERMDTIEGAPRGTHGSYSPMENLIRLRLGATDGTRAHEAGHMLDEKVGLRKILLADKDVKAELQKLAENRLSGDFELSETAEGIRFQEEVGKASKKYLEYIKNDAEVIANFFDSYVNSPEQVDAIAPKAKALFEEFLDSNSQLAFIRDIKPSTNRATEKIKKDVFGHGDLPPNTIAFWDNGKKVYVRVSKPMFEALSSMRPSQISNAARFFSATLRIGSAAPLLRFGATNTPEFIARNPVRDTLAASIQSEVGYNPLYIPRTLYKMIRRDKQYQEFVQAGGKFASFMALDDGNIEKSFEDILNPKSTLRKILSKRALPELLEAYEKIPKASETLTRFGVYRAALDRGYSPIEAAQFSLDSTLNFPRGGFATKAANQYLPFLNVGFLATEKLVRSFKNDPKTMAIRGFTYLTAPALTIAGYYLYGADDETRKEWLELPVNQIAEGRIFFKFNGEWRYIPAPYALGYVFSGLPQIALRTIHGENPDDGRALWEHLMKGAVGAVTPIQDWSSLFPPTLKVALEDVSNYDFYREKDIYSKFKEGDNVLDKDKTTPRDSEAAKAIGNFFNVSPALIDHSIYGVLGGTGGYALNAADAGINAKRRSNGEVIPEKPTTGADVVGVKAFTVRAPEGARSNSYKGWQNHYYDAQAIANHYKGMPAGSQKAEYRQENAYVLSQLPQLKGAAKVIQDRQKKIKGVTEDVHMSSEEKNNRISMLEKEITRVARNSNNQYNAARNAGN